MLFRSGAFQGGEGQQADAGDELYKNRSSRKSDSQLEKRSSGSHILLKIVSEYRFSGKTHFDTIGSSCFPLVVRGAARLHLVLQGTHPRPLGGLLRSARNLLQATGNSSLLQIFDLIATKRRYLGSKARQKNFWTL